MAPQPHSPDLLWIYPAESPEWTKQIVHELHIHPVTAQILVSRGFTSLSKIKDFLYAKLPDLFDPNLFADMDKAVDRVVEALDRGERILVYGDNDVDGMTGTALLVEFLQRVGADVVFHVPNRNDLSQSLMSEAAVCAQRLGAKLIITVDCGITAAKELEHAAAQEIDVIITDHHEPTAKLPACVATLNPKLVSSVYPNRDLTGVGVAFKLAHAITNRFAERGRKTVRPINLKSHLDLVAMGTIADMGALQGENRVLVRYGLQQLRATKRIGLKKLCEVSEVDIASVTSSDIASKIAPRLNSLGRIADPIKGVELLLIREEKRAEEMAKELDLNNIERQRIEQRMTAHVEEMLTSFPEILQNKAIVIASDQWHPGIIPIVTARLAKAYNRPTVLIAIEKGVGKGSSRTIKEFPLLPVLRECADLLLNFGGHDYAAGLTIEEGKIAEFQRRFLERANGCLGEQDIISKLPIDAKTDFEELTFDFMESLHLLEPYGSENPAPILYCDARQVRAPKVVGNSHLKFHLEQGNRQLEGIGFNMGHLLPSLRQKGLQLRVAYTPTINSFRNKVSIQLLIRGFKILS